LLTDDCEPKWTTLKPLAVKSEGGATLTVNPDDSVLASGKNPDNDVYVIEAEVQGRIGAIRLEAIPDASMPKGGSGRAPSWGNFVLTDFRVMAGDTVVAWSRADADFGQGNRQMQNGQMSTFPVAFAIDADESTGWAIWPRVAEPHWAVFIPSQPITAADKTRLTIRLSFRHKEMLKYTLGRFRLSVADEAGMVQPNDWVLAASTPHAKVGAAYLVADDAKRAVEFLSKATSINPKMPAADWLMLALAHAKLKETDQARQACGKAAASLRSAGVNRALRPLLREVSLAIGADCAEVKEMKELLDAVGEAPAGLNEAIRQKPADAAGYRNRGHWFATHGYWQEAVADFTEVFRLAPGSIDGFRLGTLLIQVGDIDRYQALCRDMLARWSSNKANYTGERVTKTCLLHPDSKVAPEALDQLAQRAVAGDPNQNAYEWYLFAKSLHDLRSAKYADALTSSRETRRRAATTAASKEMVTGLALIIESMALHHSGKPAEARIALAEAKSLLDKNAAGLESTTNWHDWLSAHVLYREAEALIAGKKADQSK
jgi:tetratricopeptide (TPR) repeat protein